MRGWLALPLLLAGCVSSPQAADAPGGDAGPGTPAVPGRWTDCEQWHLHFDGRAQDFQPEVPPGFTVAADELGLTTLFLHVTLCPDVEEALVAVPVEAPAQHEDPDRAEVAVIQVFHAGHGPTLYPEPFHERLVESTFTRSEGPAGPELVIVGGGETTRLTVAMRPSSGAFAAERWIRFAGDGDALGVVTADGNESANLGYGAVVYRHEGPGGAPPATAGIAHLVRDADFEFTSEVRA